MNSRWRYNAFLLLSVGRVRLGASPCFQYSCFANRLLAVASYLTSRHESGVHLLNSKSKKRSIPELWTCFIGMAFCVHQTQLPTQELISGRGSLLPGNYRLKQQHGAKEMFIYTPSFPFHLQRPGMLSSSIHSVNCSWGNRLEIFLSVNAPTADVLDSHTVAAVVIFRLWLHQCALQIRLLAPFKPNNWKKRVFYTKRQIL